MASTEMRWKASPKKIKGQSKPFIDKNLQIQIPELDSLPCFYNANLYHSSSQSHDSPNFSEEIVALESQLDATILEAHQAYTAWKKMQSTLKQATHKIKN